jgi:hypothetical protein
MKKIYQDTENKGGYMTLLSVLIVGAIAVAVTVSIIFSGLSAGRDGFAYQQMQQAKAFASACAEESLNQIRSAISFVGSGTLNFDLGTCSYTVTNQGGENRAISVTGTVGTVVRKMNITVSAINPLVVVSTWQEI